MKDKNGTEIKVGDTMRCNDLHFKIEEFKLMKTGETLACGDYGCLNTDLLEKVTENE